MRSRFKERLRKRPGKTSPVTKPSNGTLTQFEPMREDAYFTVGGRGSERNIEVFDLYTLPASSWYTLVPVTLVTTNYWSK